VPLRADHGIPEQFPELLAIASPPRPGRCQKNVVERFIVRMIARGAML
jgi:hypothetical protein